jgi:two-component system, sensor histidine kinase and response regulator
MKSHSILVIDDEPNNFEVIETLLASDNYDVYYANNGEEALASLDTFNPDVILLDLMMPVMDGLEVCQRLRLMRKWRSIPIIMVTASSGKPVLAKCLEAGADDFINKPVDGLELRARVKSMVRTKRQFDRIESLTKLQQKNITLLENDLGELGCDLAVGFGNELTKPLSNIIDRLQHLDLNIDELELAVISDAIKSANRSALELEQLTSKFWIYLELALEKKQFDNQESCNIRKIIYQISTVRSESFCRAEDLSIELQNANIAVSEQHCEWIVKELLDNAFKSSEPDLIVKICGRIIDRTYHLWVSDCLDDSIKDQELALGLKIIKKIVDIYDGTFTRMTVDNDQMIYITLPL